MAAARAATQRRSSLALGALVFLLLSCTGSDPSDPCEGLELPLCPAACPTGAFARCGASCSVEGEACGNEIGDGMRCTGGTWECTVHPPLGTGCNRICRAVPR